MHKYKFILTIMIFVCPLYMYGQIITTVAGNGFLGYSGDNNLAINARISHANSAVVDHFGNIYISDCQNNCIRKVDNNTGIITTVAGTGVAGYNGDGILAINAQLNGPSSNISFDTSGNYYFGDFNNNRIRKVEITTGIITTIAGTGVAGYNGDSIQAVSAQLYHPQGVAIDKYGNIFFADNANHRIRKVNVTTGIIYTVAGNGIGGYNSDGIQALLAQLKFPVGLAFDSSGNLLIADWQNNRIRKVNVTSGIISTIAGTGANTFNGDGIVATTASISTPVGLTFDSSWNLYIGSEFNYRIRKVNSFNNIITTVAGTGSAGYNGDTIPAINALLNSPGVGTIDLCGNLLIADGQNQRIRKVWFNIDTLPQVNIAITPNDTVITGTTVTTNAIATNHGTITSYQWVKNGANAGTNNAYTYTPVNGDSVYCIVTVKGCTGRIYTDTTTAIHITVTGGAGIAKTTTNTTHTYPNPVTDVLHVATTEALHYVLHNLMGVTLLQGSVDMQNSIDMKAIPSGIYLLQLTNAEGQREVVRVVKE